MRRTRVLLMAVCLTSAIGVARAKEAESPQVAAKASMLAAKKGDWSAYTHYMHPDALAKAKRLFGTVVAADESGRVRKLFFGVDDTKSFDALSDSACFVALMANLSVHMPAFAEAMKNAEFHVIGTLPEGDDLVHIVYRTDTKAEELEISRTSVLSLRRSGEEWRMLLTGNIEGLAARLSQMSGARH